MSGRATSRKSVAGGCARPGFSQWAQRMPRYPSEATETGGGIAGAPICASDVRLRLRPSQLSPAPFASHKHLRSFKSSGTRRRLRFGRQAQLRGASLCCTGIAKGFPSKSAAHASRQRWTSTAQVYSKHASGAVVDPSSSPPLSTEVLRSSTRLGRRCRKGPIAATRP